MLLIRVVGGTSRCLGWILLDSPLTAVNAQMLLQVMFVLESFSTLATFELAVSCCFIQQLQKEKTESQNQAVRLTLTQGVSDMIKFQSRESTDH